MAIRVKCLNNLNIVKTTIELSKRINDNDMIIFIEKKSR